MVVEIASMNFLEYQWSGAKVEVDKRRNGFCYTFLWSYMFLCELDFITCHTTLYVVPWRGLAPEPVYKPPRDRMPAFPVFPLPAPRSNHKCQLLSLPTSFLSCLPFVILASCNSVSRLQKFNLVLFYICLVFFMIIVIILSITSFVSTH